MFSAFVDSRPKYEAGGWPRIDDLDPALVFALAASAIDSRPISPKHPVNIERTSPARAGPGHASSQNPYNATPTIPHTQSMVPRQPSTPVHSVLPTRTFRVYRFCRSGSRVPDTPNSPTGIVLHHAQIPRQWAHMRDWIVLVCPDPVPPGASIHRKPMNTACFAVL